MTDDKKAPKKKAAPKKTTKSAAKSSVKQPAAKKATVKKVSASKKPTAKNSAPNKPILEEPVISVASESSENTTSSENAHAKKTKSTHEDADNVFPGLAKDRDWQNFVLRVAYIITFGVLGWLAFGAAITMTIIQVVITVLLGAPNETLQNWVSAIGKYLAEVFEYISWSTDEKPFPLGRPVPLK